MKRDQLKFMAYYFCFFAGLSCILSYINVYLEKVQGFTGTQLGIYTSLTGLFPAFLIPAVGYLADKTGRHDILLHGNKEQLRNPPWHRLCRMAAFWNPYRLDCRTLWKLERYFPSVLRYYPYGLFCRPHLSKEKEYGKSRLFPKYS